MARNRFKKEKSGFDAAKSLLLPVGSFALLFVLFLGGLRSVSASAAVQQQQSLEAAIRRSAVHCYASEGAYPDTMEYLVEHYGIRYDATRYLVDYQIFASNLMPDITVIAL